MKIQMTVGAIALACLTMSAQGAATEMIASGFQKAIALTGAPGDTSRVYVLEQAGRVRAIDLGSGTVTDVLDFGEKVHFAGQQGAFGLTFHPEFQQNGHLFVHYAKNGASTDVVVERYTMNSDGGGGFDPLSADPASGQQVIRLPKPTPSHAGGWMGFAPVDDGNYLYITIGEGDERELAQDLTNPIGAVLRLDVDGDDFPGDDERNYAIPPSNPFVDVEGAAGEIWLYGLRNPWRASFDRETGDFYICDVGQTSAEEISFVPAHVPGTMPGDEGYNGGLNLGWPCKEGLLCDEDQESCSCDDPTLIDPFFTYTQSGGKCAVVGGYVYRGSEIPALYGRYFHLDVCTEQVWSFVTDGQTVSDIKEHTDEFDPEVGNLFKMVTFGEDTAGELYLPSWNGSGIFKVVPGECVADLDASGSVDSTDLNLLLLAFGGTNADADIDASGTVDSADLNLLLAKFGTTCQ